MTPPTRRSWPARSVEAGVEVLSGIGAACVATALLWARQEQIVWQPPGRGGPDPGAPPAGARRLTYTAEDGQALLAWVVDPPPAAPGTAAPTLLAFHGNAELAAWGVPWARAVAARTGWRVALPEYRGYAGLGGRSGHDASRRDARAALAAVGADAGDGRSPVAAVFGHSLGSAVAAELAVEMAAGGAPPGVLVLQAPFTSIRDMTRLFAPAPLGAWWTRIGRIHFDTAARVAELDVPVWVTHGALDLIVPQRLGRAVHAAARRPGEWLGLPTAGHNDVPAVGGVRYWAWLERALAAAVPAERVVRVGP